MKQKAKKEKHLNENKIMTEKTEHTQEQEEIQSEKVNEVTDSTDKNQEQELQEAKDKYLRVYAEFENFRKRNAKEKLELIQTAGREIISELLTVVDDFERSLKANENMENKEGFELVYRKLQNILISKGLQLMDVKGKPFDPDFHEAITQIPVKDKKQKGRIVEVIENGYTLNGIVIRYAKVVVGE